jgi:MFS family permease
MLRVLGMLAGILLGGLIGVVVGGLVGGFAGLIAWPVWGRQVAMDTAIGIGGITAMAVAVIAGVWSGVYATLGSEARQQSPFTWWVVNRLMFLAAITSVQGYAAFFLMYSFNTSREDAAVMTGNLFLVVGACTILTTLPSGWLSDRFGQKRIVGLSGLLAAVAMLFLMATAWLHSLALVYAGGVLLGLATGLFVTTNWALGTRLVPLAQAGRYLGISNLAGAGAGMIGSGLGGPVADWLNASLPGLGYFTIFAGYGVLFLLSTASLRRIREEVQTT